MSQENADAVQALYDRFREGDFRPSVELLDRHVVFMPMLDLPDAPETGLYSGVEALAEWMRGLFENFADLTMEAVDLIPAGDSVLVSVRQRGVARRSGIPSDARYYTLWSFRGSKVIRIETFRERARALEAAGLSAAPSPPP
jgi:ketosteroid isomerase-like protein